jgi:hypothetical protein
MEQQSHTTTDTLDQAEEEILNHTVSDEALEAACGREGAAQTRQPGSWTGCC